MDKTQNKTKKFNVTYQYSQIGTVTIYVPEEMTLKEAIEYARDNIDEIPLPTNGEYIQDSDIIDEENCDFEDED